ncbi:MAG: DNA-directed RNA polymerase subunit H [Methanobacteriota archaeon]|jgi:DNA-directed RNA polymerase subunit H
MKFDVLKHELVPQHEVLPEEDANELLKKFNITKEQIPKILVSDQVAKKIGAKIGDVAKITRNSKTAGKSVVYRVVVAE